MICKLVGKSCQVSQILCLRGIQGSEYRVMDVSKLSTEDCSTHYRIHITF